GWKMRVAMARVLLGQPDVLLMDEPTNHLDIESIVWLERFLKSRSGALLMTSHDREFMNRAVGKIAEIDSGEITMYSGNYDFYEREREIRDANREAAYARQQAMLAKEQRFIDRFAAHAAKAAQVQSRVKPLVKMVAGQLMPDRGHVRLGASVKMGYFAQLSLDLLDADLTVEEQLRRDFPHESIGALRNLAGAFQFSGEDVDKKIRALSGGEKTRLVLARMLLDPPNLLVLEEPTSHLDLATKEMLLEALNVSDGT